jgi:hypothetical protein
MTRTLSISSMSLIAPVPVLLKSNRRSRATSTVGRLPKDGTTRKATNRKRERIDARVPHQTKEKFIVLAQIRGVSQSELLRQLVDEEADRQLERYNPAARPPIAPIRLRRTA